MTRRNRLARLEARSSAGVLTLFKSIIEGQPGEPISIEVWRPDHEDQRRRFDRDESETADAFLDRVHVSEREASGAAAVVLLECDALKL